MLNYRIQGEGAPVVLIHGLFGSLENLGAQSKYLAKHFQVISVDLPNHGRSPHVDEMSLGSMAESVFAFLDELQIEKPLLVGHSLGGKVAMEMALSQPEGVRAVVVLDIAPHAYTPRHTEVFAGLNALASAEIASRQQADHILAPHVPELAVRSFLLKNLVRDEAGFSFRINLIGIERAYTQLIAGNREVAEPIDVPVLFVKGGASDYLTESSREAITCRFARPRTHIVANTGHWLHAEKPEQVAGIIEKFLTQVLV